ncbi:MAG: trigger factor [Bdellovibrionales bacterium]|nr:trigger factor [Bdellovibrionales bacterium]
MKCELSNLSGLKRKLDIQLSSEQVQRGFDEAYKAKQKKVHLPGFRKGKVPLNHIRSMYHEEIKRDTVISLINEFYRKALEQAKLKPASEPKIDLKSKIDENQGFGFSAVLEIQPEITIDKNFKVQISKLSSEVAEKEIDQSLENIRAASANFELITEDRAVNWGDIAELEIKELSGSIGIEKKPLLEIKKENKLEIKGLIEEIIGMKVKDKKKISVELSDKYPIKEQAGKSADLEVSLLAIKKRMLPDLNDEFVKKFKCQDIQEMRLMIRRSLEQEKKNKNYDHMREETLKQLVDKNPIDLLPEGIIEEQKQTITSSVVDRLKKAGLKEGEIEQYKKKYQTDLQKQARFMVHSSYLIYALAGELDISISPQEVQMYFQSTQPGKTQTDEEYRQIESILIQEKTIKHLIDKATEI